MRAPSRERYLMHGLFGKCAGTGRRRSRTQVSTPWVRPACLPARRFVYTRCGTRAGDATQGREVPSVRADGAGRATKPRYATGVFVSRARIHHGSGGTGFWRWDRARPVVGWRTGRSSGTHRYAGCCNDPQDDEHFPSIDTIHRSVLSFYASRRCVVNTCMLAN